MWGRKRAGERGGGEGRERERGAEAEAEAAGIGADIYPRPCVTGSAKSAMMNVLAGINPQCTPPPSFSSSTTRTLLVSASPRPFRSAIFPTLLYYSLTHSYFRSLYTWPTRWVRAPSPTWWRSARAFQNLYACAPTIHIHQAIHRPKQSSTRRFVSFSLYTGGTLLHSFECASLSRVSSDTTGRYLFITVFVYTQRQVDFH